MTNNTRILLLIVCLLPLALWSQTMVWQLKPTDYTDISRFGSNMYVVTKDGKKGLIRADGSEVVPVGIDEIGGFYEHRALLLCHDGDKERIAGYLTDDGHYTPFAQQFYTLKGQEFYSDGLLTVADAKGNKGYVNEKGQPEFGFDKKYYRIKPFSEGFAAVSPKQNFYYLVNKEGTKVIIKLPQIGEVGQVSNAFHGIAYVLDTDNNFYTYNVTTGHCETTRLKSSDTGKDYLFRLKKDSQCGNTVPYTTLPEGKKGLAPTEKDGKMGFEQNGHIFLPAQLDAATTIEDGLSIVKLNGMLGILKLVEGDSDFTLLVPDTLIEFNAGTSVSCNFSLQIPKVWDGKTLEVSVANRETGEALAATSHDGVYAVELSPKSSGQSTFHIAVASEGLHLWSGSATYTLKKRIVDLMVSALALNSETADEDDRISGSFTVTNPNEEEMTAELSFKHSSGINSNTCPASITVPPGESRTVSFQIVVKQDCQDQTISVSTSRGGSATLSIANLNAF